MINILWVGKQRCSNTNTVFLKHHFFTQKLHVYGVPKMEQCVPTIEQFKFGI